MNLNAMSPWRKQFVLGYSTCLLSVLKTDHGYPLDACGWTLDSISPIDEQGLVFRCLEFLLWPWDDQTSIQQVIEAVTESRKYDQGYLYTARCAGRDFCQSTLGGSGFSDRRVFDSQTRYKLYQICQSISEKYPTPHLASSVTG